MPIPHRLAGVSAALMVCVGALWSAAAPAQSDYPSRPVRILVPYAPGGATDIVARQLAAKLGDALGGSVIVENRAGGSGIIALEATVNAAPDGYTLLVGNVSTNAINETAFAKTLKFKPSQALAGVTNLVELPHFFMVSAATPVSTFAELIAYAKKSPKPLAYASAGIGSYPHLDAARWLKAAGIEMIHVPYKGGAGQIVPAMLSNETQFVMLNMASSMAHLRSGKIRALATTWPTRRPEFPDVPTMAEAGYPGIGTNAWQGLFAQAKLPKPILDRIYAATAKVMRAPEMQEALAKQFMSVVVNDSPADFQRFVEEEVRKWGAVITDNKIVIE